MDFHHILVVCAGNICRSPMAEALLKSQFPQLNISSAGLINLHGQAADEKAQQCMQQLGLDISKHQSRLILKEHVKTADVILVMSMQQQHHVEEIFSFSKGKVFRLGHWRNIDISDPYQKSQQIFNEACALIQHCIQDWNIYFKE